MVILSDLSQNNILPTTMKRLFTIILLITITLSCGKSSGDNFQNERLVIISETPELPLDSNGDRLFPLEGGKVEIIFELNFDDAVVHGSAYGKKRNKYRVATIDDLTISFYESPDDFTGIPHKLKAGRHKLIVTSYPIPSSEFYADEVGGGFSIGIWKEHNDSYGNLIDITGGGFSFFQQISY